MKAPFFSIIIPSYNRGSFLDQTLHSVLNQSWQDFEILIIDDGSKDDTSEVVTKMQAEDERISYHYKENGERGAARNYGISKAKAPYCVFFDSDDEMLPGYLAILKKSIDQNPNVNFFAARYKFLRNGNIYPSSTSSMKSGLYNKEIVLKGNPFACNLCIARDHSGLKLFENDRTLATMEDWMFLVENLYQENIFLVEEECLLMHQHEGRSMQQDKLLIERRLRATDLLCQKIPFSKAEADLIKAYSYYFCSIHAFTDNDRRLAIEFIRKAIDLAGWNSLFTKAYLKYSLGKPFTDRLKSLLKFER